jgi:cell division protein FtsI/penicillin-binding protein 2
MNEQGAASGQRIVSEKAAVAAREMMYGVVENEHGTGGNAKIEGLRVGGKTGTAQKASPKGRGYMAGSYVASFVGFADGTPLGVPRNITTMVIIDEPKAKSIYGGTLAARRVSSRTPPTRRLRFQPLLNWARSRARF